MDGGSSDRLMQFSTSAASRPESTPLFPLMTMSIVRLEAAAYHGMDAYSELLVMQTAFEGGEEGNMDFRSASAISFVFFLLYSYCIIATLEIQHLASCLMFMQFNF